MKHTFIVSNSQPGLFSQNETVPGAVRPRQDQGIYKDMEAENG